MSTIMSEAPNGSPPKTAYTKQFQALFTRDVINHVEEVEAGGWGAWEYSEPAENDPTDLVQGWGEWGIFLRDHGSPEEYYILDAEIKLAAVVAPRMPKLITPPLSIAFLGPGTRDAFTKKDLILTQQFRRVHSARAFDINSRYIQMAIREIPNWFPKAQVGGDVVDLFKVDTPNQNNPPAHFFFPQNGSRQPTRLATLFGGTLLNVPGFVHDGPPQEAVTEKLKMIRRALGKGGFLVITQDANQDKEKIERAYVNQKAFASNLSHRILRDTPYNVDPDKTEFRVEWHPESMVLAHYLRFYPGQLTERNPNPIDKEIHINNSYKIPHETFLQWAEKAKFKPVLSEEENGVYLHVLEATK